MQDRIHPIQGYRGSEKNLLFLHHSLGTHIFDEVVGLPDEIVAVYHNLTPERYFADEAFRRLIRLGHEQLAQLAHRARVGVADSNHNRREMLAVGFRRVEVLAGPCRLFPILRALHRSRLRSTDWLYVGRIVGNKCQHDLVRAFALYAKTFDGEARLVLIGDTSVSDYVAFVQREAVRLGVADRVVMLGKVSDNHLRSAFAGAGVFVSMSEHEGFGVPILEAMAAGVPVVAFGAAAVPEIMGGAGILLRVKDPEVVAATVQALRADPGLRERLVDRQFVRVGKVQEFDVPALLERVIDRAVGSRAAVRGPDPGTVRNQLQPGGDQSEARVRAGRAARPRRVDLRHRGSRRLRAGSEGSRPPPPGDGALPPVARTCRTPTSSSGRCTPRG